MKRMTRLAASAAFVAAIAAGALALPESMFSASANEPKPAAEAPKPPAITVIPAARKEVVQTAIVVGSLVPREEVLVGVDLDGYRLTDLSAEEGDHVKAGQVLARLSTDMLDVQLAQNASSLARNDAAIAQAKSQIAEATAVEAQANAAFDRGQSLKTKGIVAQDALDLRESTAKTAAARRDAAAQGLALAEADKALTEAQRRELQLRVAKTEIKAPTDGLVLSRSARIGAIVSGGGEPLFRLAEDGAIELEAQVPEAELAQIAVGQPVKVTVQGAPEGIQGSVRLVAPRIDNTSRLGRLRVALPADVKVNAGAFARGTVELARREVVAIPVSAVVTTAGEATTQVVVDGKIQTRPIKTGISGRGLVEVVDGVVAGEAVVLRAGTFVRDGDAVTPVEAQDETKGEAKHETQSEGAKG
ncbi:MULTISPECIES: efflux RND transporter periplasmic adaptor subunit [Kaistia]|uniref:Efflux RND transporter periplasmic adaptor subunit n=1 Tax=Kaistia nematophila TaxID=2994654 RepID=A0A9X3DYF3_9HYPH|nr:efflux RND transporter periplasmic adaptor subunit [Kaistia nematophila]MBN9027516.1 efflux RND transporter periplasmic adaptor subunit [Hyphomicrobiales bacterium]MCX5568254.1 efflux RND transporter periplasmic adaptor subunit [Kaistia nematophila]